MNFLVKKYDSALKQMIIQLGSSEKLAQARLKAIERVRAVHKKANEKAAKEKEVLRVKFEELEGKLKSAGAAKKELARENTRLEEAAATLEKEKTELLEERDAAVEKLIRERQHLRDSRGLEVTREKGNRYFGRVRDHLTRLDAFGKAKNLYGQASGTRKCLEMIKASGTEIPQEMIDVFAEQEKLYEAEATKFCVGLLSDSDLTLSLLVLPSRFVEDKFRASFDPYGSNVGLIGPGMVSQLITSLKITEESSEEPLLDVTKDNPEIGNTPVREEETGNVGIEEPVLVSDSSSEGREGEEEEDDRVEETSSLQPVEEEKTDEVGNRDVPPPPAVDSLVSIPTRVEDPTVAATEDPVGPSALGTPEETYSYFIGKSLFSSRLLDLRVVVFPIFGNSDVSGSKDKGRDQGDTATGSERGDTDESDRSPTPLRQVRKRVCFDQIDCRPTIYHPGEIFEELAPLPPGLLRDPRAQSWGNMFGSSASHHTVRDLLRASGGAGFVIRIRSPTPGCFSKMLKRSRRIVIFVGRILVGSGYVVSKLGSLESRLPCVLSPRKSRLPLFTRKQRRLLDKAREMDGVPDLGALLKGKLQLLTKKSTTVDPQGPSNFGVDITSEGGGTSREGASKEGASREEGPNATDQGGTPETSASGPKRKKKTKRTKVGATDEVPPEESASLDATSEGSKAKKKKDGRKRSRGGAEGQEAVLVGATSDGHPRKRTKRSVEAEPCPSTSDANAADAAIIDAVGEASGTPGNLERGKLQLLTKKSTTVDPQEPSNSGVDVTSEGGGTSREGASKEGASREEGPIATDQEARQKLLLKGSKAKKKKDGRKRSRGRAEGQEAILVGATSDGHPRKRTKRSVEAEPRPSTSDANAADAALVDAVGEANGTPGNLSEERRKTCSREGGSGGESARSTPDSSARKRSGSEGSVAKRKRIEFPDRVEFSYNETTPLILNSLRCVELIRQIRGGMKEMPQLEDLYFKNEYIDTASSRAWSDGSMNFLVEKYDSALKQTMIQLGSSEKLARARLKAIERVRAEHKKANEKAAKEKEVLRVKFEELEGKLKSAGAAKKELARENTRLEQATATIEREKTELLEERDAAVEKLIRERQRLRDSWGLEVTRERERVEAAMVEKANRCFGREHDHFTRLDAFGKAKNLYGQASGTRKCVEMIKASGTEILQEMIDIFAEQEKLYEAEATKFCVGLLSDSDLTLSPLVLPSRFVEDRFRASFDPYGSNVDLIRPGMVSQLINSLKITEEPSEEPLVDVTSVPAEHVKVPEGGCPGEHPENENLEEVPGKDNLELGNTPVREEETGNLGIEDPILISDSSSKGREGEEEEDDRVEETSSLQPVEEEKTDEVGNRDVPPPPAVDSLVPVPTRVEDPTVTATEDPVGPSALGTPEEVG
ncbi:hypothetical protein F2Q69_00015986 [Brassica cretica]|uniref:Uncharacterized protein n=1 Tax=Brassica cretica TaxID=69181 RepID=A0A8S9QSH5_BRACR|nr:hypothetical protein F2Q69_00015986 [Brassica cretica]